jgi:hypothetical protein
VADWQADHAVQLERLGLSLAADGRCRLDRRVNRAD